MEKLTYHYKNYVYEADTGVLISPHGNLLWGKTVHLPKGKVNRPRFIWFMVHGKWPDGQIIHLDGNSKNDRLHNLRDMPANEIRCLNKQSKWKGVAYHPRNVDNPWLARMSTIDKKREIIGYYKTKEEAVAAHKAAVEKRNAKILRKHNALSN